MNAGISGGIAGLLVLIALTNGACSSKDTSVTHPSDAGTDGRVNGGGATGAGGAGAAGGAKSKPDAHVTPAAGGGTGISDSAIPGVDAHKEPIHGAALAAGANHTCLLTTTGQVRCWGSDEHGEVGNPDTVGRGNYPGTHPVAGLAAAIAVSAGFDESCAILTTDHEAWCWGNNDNGQLGRGTALPPDADPHVVPGLVAGVAGVIQIAIGATHACAVLEGGELACWGSHEDGERGPNVDGGALSASTPSLVQFAPSVTVKQVATGASFTCALTGLGTVLCFGDNSVGQLGRPSQSAQRDPVPTAVPSLANVTEIAAGGSTACALLKSGVIECWGFGAYGQLGRGPTDGASPDPGPTPVPVVLPASRTAKHVSLSPGAKLPEGIGCALLDDDTVACWGANVWGQTGAGTVGSNGYVTPAAIFTPAVVKGMSEKPVAIAPAQFHACALLEGGGATCWGANGGGQLGADPNLMAGAHPTPAPVIYEYVP